ncbi:MAG: winged helix DNA-binding domain-containing protein, partial [Paracoccaceae bacterium]|nr:winged helix DNA-binding domain-containing protein [Paracoccaceae bacterium]
MPLRIANRDARRLWLHAQGLSEAPRGGADLASLIARLGFVQLDSIRVVARAHDHILWSRMQSYRPGQLDKLLSERAVFEHFTHDASVLPVETFPYWTRQFRRRRAHMESSAWWLRQLPGKAQRRAIRDRIAAEGPLSTADFENLGPRPQEMWIRPAHKAALDYLWHAGELATHARVNFVKHYDLAERVIPEPMRAAEATDAAQIDWLCQGALARLGFASPGEIQRFWDAASPAEVKAWLFRAGTVPVEIEAADGRLFQALAPPDIEARLAEAPAPTARLRILNPFDPAVRDRTRLERLFGFDYRNEIFVPAEKRRWGYYVMPLIEGDRFVGRIEAKADRGAGLLTATRIWAEPGVRWTAARQVRLEAELARLARLARCGESRLSAAAL